MAAPDWELNLFSANPRLLQPQDDLHYERAAGIAAALGSTTRLKLLHALLIGERSVIRAAAWARLPQALAEAELREMEARGLVARVLNADEIEYVPRDGHLVVLLYVALAHGRHGHLDARPQPLLLPTKRPVANARARAGE